MTDASSEPETTSMRQTVDMIVIASTKLRPIKYELRLDSQKLDEVRETAI